MIHQRKKGFTLIELIIAITILAILAVGLIAALDPVEQINKSRDSVRRDQVIQIAEALERYYAIHEDYLVGVTGSHINGYPNQGTLVTNTAAEAYKMVDALSKLGELKNNFYTVNQSNLSKVWVYRKDVGTLETPVVCTEVSSKAMGSQANLWTMATDTTYAATSPNLTIAIPLQGPVPASNAAQDCTKASGTYRNYCAFCVAVQP